MNTRRVALFGLLSSAVVMVGVACSSSESSPNGGDSPSNTDASTTKPDASRPPPFDAAVEPTIEAACESLATAICAKVQSCSTFGLSVTYGDLDTCKTRNVLSCKTSAVANGQKATASNLNTCATSISTLDCAKVVALDFGPACTVAGTLKNGEPCGYNGQCESTFCALAPDQSCGTCAPVTSEGDACVNKACSAGLACSEVDSKCYQPGTAAVGESCNRLSDCDLANQSGCNTVSHKCLALTLAEAGGTCGADSINPSKFALCPKSAACSGTINGTCSSSVAEGESCGDKGPSCVPPARCVDGTCALPAPNCQ